MVIHGDIDPYALIWDNRVGMLPPRRKHAITEDLVTYKKRLERKTIPSQPQLKKNWWLAR
ncbi:MAG: hypothetical protein ACXAEU_10700 [Candidatus Hodarchaeales archaeon]